jgi:hypothetical protein
VPAGTLAAKEVPTAIIPIAEAMAAVSRVFFAMLVMFIFAPVFIIALLSN